MMTTDRILTNIEFIEGDYIRKTGKKPKLLVRIGKLTYAKLRNENAYETDRIRFDTVNKKIAKHDYYIGGEKESCKIFVINESIDVDMGV